MGSDARQRFIAAVPVNYPGQWDGGLIVREGPGLSSGNPTTQPVFQDPSLVGRG